MNLLVFAGTTEGTDFTQKALAAGHTVTVSVATDYGADILQSHLPASERLHVLHGRLDADEIASIVPHFDALVDATHPYAAEVTKNLRAASSVASVPYYRLSRPVQSVSAKNLHEFDDLASLVSALSQTSGAIFVSTGSRDLSAFTSIPDYQNRLFIRVLPSVESIEKCRSLGFSPSHIIAMQGAFSTELNKALFAEYNCRILVTKESGAAGGFAEKIYAAESLGMEIYALKAPAESDGANRFSSASDLLSALKSPKGD
ncbi:MAG: precorrin-6A reductase [Treponema sp.]|nr:precorrin-6A reductase [Treponema sp.]